MTGSGISIVVYNPRDMPTVVSHDSWILLLSPATLELNQTWFAMRELSEPHWVSFLFD
jgi:hypothetical protein